MAWSWVISCHLPLLDFHCRQRTASFTAMPRLDVYLVCFTCLTFCGISLLYRAFYHFLVLGCCVFRSTNLIDKNGSRKLPFSASNFDNSCRLLRHPLCLFNLQVLSLFNMAFYHHLTLRGCDLNLANLIAKKWELESSIFTIELAVIRCVTWLHFCFASGLSPLARGFYHICSQLSVDCGGSIPPS